LILLLNKLRNLSFFTHILASGEKTPDAELKFEALYTDQYQYKNVFKLYIP